MKLAVALIALLAPATPVVERQPAATDEEVWALARKVNLRAAYDVYRRRFPTGVHAGDAIERAYALQGKPVLVVPPPPPGAPPLLPRVTPIPRAEVDPCTRIMVDQEFGLADTAEGKAVLEMRRTNRLEDYRAFLVKFPHGTCRETVQGRISDRERLRASFAAIPGFGPLAAKALATRNVFIEDDYPVAALRNGEQGRATAEWDVAADGIVELCHVVKSSGSQTLDGTTCRLITRRMRYDPARNAAGEPTRSSDHMTVNWILPEESPAEEPAKSGL